jgi:hypothetical protein
VRDLARSEGEEVVRYAPKLFRPLAARLMPAGTGGVFVANYSSHLPLPHLGSR